MNNRLLNSTGYILLVTGLNLLFSYLAIEGFKTFGGDGFYSAVTVWYLIAMPLITLLGILFILLELFNSQPHVITPHQPI